MNIQAVTWGTAGYLGGLKLQPCAEPGHVFLKVFLYADKESIILIGIPSK